MPLVGYPGDRRIEYVEEDDAELAALYLADGLRMREIVDLFRGDKKELWQACNIYQAGKHLVEMRKRNPAYKLKP